MKLGAIATALTAAFALTGVLVAFSTNASPYVTISQARSAPGDRLHVAGDIDQKSVHMDILHHSLAFDIVDKTGRMHVVHNGEMPANIREAHQVVAVGAMAGDHFSSHQLLVKCPSKYEAGKTEKVASR